MNGIVKVASRLSSLKTALNPFKQTIFGVSGRQNSFLINPGRRQFTRTLWHMCSSKNECSRDDKRWCSRSQACGCGCSNHQLHTKAEKDLVDFLTDEIATERKAQQKKHIPTEFEGFKVEVHASEVTLTKKSGEETVILYFNVNHTVDAAATGADINPNMEKPDFAEMKSRPGFEVEIVRGTETLGFTCSFLDENVESNEDGYNDVFSIDEITMYDGEWSEKTYAVAGEIIDGNLYDLLMNLLEEKGVSNEFVDKLSEFSTMYEHKLYVGLLEKLQHFASGK